MREITCAAITEAVAKLCVRAATWLPPDIAIMLDCASDSEDSPAGVSVLDDLIENFNIASRSGLPICQDTGMAVVFADIGQDAHITGGSFRDAVNEGVRIGYEAGFLRKSIVRDPFRRVNTGDNTPAVLHARIIDGDELRLTVAPKGFGSENMSALRMFLPSDTPETVEDYIVGAVSEAGSNPCPPVILGVGLGGTAEYAAILAKRALLRPIDVRNPDPFYAGMERRLMDKVNRLGIGPQGFGGSVTALGVNIEVYPTHIAGLPCAVDIGCHATRRASCTL